MHFVLIKSCEQQGQMALHRLREGYKEERSAHWLELDSQLAWCNEQIDSHVRTDARAKKAAQLHGIGAVTASAIVAGVGEFSQFRNARQFGAWLGLVPSQNSSGGKTSLGGITKTW